MMDTNDALQSAYSLVANGGVPSDDDQQSLTNILEPFFSSLESYLLRIRERFSSELSYAAHRRRLNKVLNEFIDTEKWLKREQSTDQTLDPDQLGLLFESSLCAEALQKQGSVYTPRRVARSMLELLWQSSVQSTELSLNHTVFDPACGSAVFLRERLAQLAEQIEDEHELVKIAEQTIFGADINPEAVIASKLCLTLQFYYELAQRPGGECLDSLDPPNFNRNIVHTNTPLLRSLIDPNELHKYSQQHLTFCPEKAFGLSSFNWIIGNPPFGISRDDKISISEKQLLKKLYGKYKFGKINKFLAFSAAALELLSKRGKLCFLTPNSWMGIPSAKVFRHHLLSEKWIKLIRILPATTFKQKGVETLICLMDRSVQQQNIRIEPLESSPFTLSSKRCLASPDFVVPLHWSDKCAEVFDHLDHSSVPLGSDASPVEASIALQAYALGKGNPAQNESDVRDHIYHASSRINESYHPYLEGRDIDRFRLDTPRSFLSHGPWLAEPQPLDRFQGDRVLIREVLSPAPYLMKAVYTDQLYLYNKSVLHLLPKKGTSQDLMKLLEVLLNSTLASYVVFYRGRKSQRKLFPKIIAEDLQNFPLPRPDALDQFSSCLLQRRTLLISQLNEVPLSANWRRLRLRKLLPHPLLQTLQEIDQLIFELYELPRDVQEELRSFGHKTS